MDENFMSKTGREENEGSGFVSKAGISALGDVVENHGFTGAETKRVLKDGRIGKSMFDGSPEPDERTGTPHAKRSSHTKGERATNDTANPAEPNVESGMPIAARRMTATAARKCAASALNASTGEDDEAVTPDEAYESFRRAQRGLSYANGRLSRNSHATGSTSGQPDSFGQEGFDIPTSSSRPSRAGRAQRADRNAPAVATGKDVYNTEAARDPFGISTTSKNIPSTPKRPRLFDSGRRPEPAPLPDKPHHIDRMQRRRAVLAARSKASTASEVEKCSSSLGARAKAAFSIKAPTAQTAGKAAISGSIALVAMAFIVIASLLTTFVLFMGTGEEKKANFGALEGNAAIVAQYLSGKGLDNVSIAAILGNMQQESGIDPARCQDGGPGRGLLQWEEGSDRFAELCRRASNAGKQWTDIYVQLDFMTDEAPGVFDTYSTMYHVYPTGAIAGLGTHMSFEEWKNVDDIEWATESWERVYTRASLPMMEARIAAAKDYLEKLNSPGGVWGGQDYASATPAQKAMVDAAVSGNMYGTVGGQCEAWVERVYQAAGHAYPYMCCATGAWEAWGVSTSQTGIPVGACVYGRSNPWMGGGCHPDYGHVGIYLGDGMVASNNGGSSPTIQTLAEWGAVFPYKGWGWCGGTPLN